MPDWLKPETIGDVITRLGKWVELGFRPTGHSPRRRAGHKPSARRQRSQGHRQAESRPGSGLFQSELLPVDFNDEAFRRVCRGESLRKPCEQGPRVILGDRKSMCCHLQHQARGPDPRRIGRAPQLPH
ncbi:hypothetical protein GCM10010335_64980 [Streptomyces galbus]|nr:hypothetical protein GCM10010335_64980 [Streptomyces galbus]